MTARRETLLSLAFAIWGLALGIAAIALWDRPATPDQMAGFARSNGFDAHGPFRWIAGLMLLPIAMPLLLRPLARRLAVGEAWARDAVMVAPLVTLWLATVHRDVFWALVPCAITIAVCTLLRDRDLAFTRRDAVLFATFLPTLLAITDIDPGLSADAAIYLAALLILGIRIAVAFLPSPLPPALAFVAAPLGLVLQTGFFARDQRYLGWHALAIAVITPFVLRLVLRNGRRATQLLVLVVYPLTLYAYVNALSLGTAEGKPRLDFFEDGHALLPASEYLRGELPYRDMLPAHGLIEDGLFDAAMMRFGETSLGARGKARLVVGSLATVALYAVAFAATGSAEGAFFAVLLASMTGVFRSTIRILPALAALAFLAAAVRRRRPRWFAWAGFWVVLAGLTSLDFGAYAFLTLIVALCRAPARRDAMRSASIGIAIAAIPLLLILIAFGIADDFLRGTFLETLSAGPAYTLNFFTPPGELKGLSAFPDAFAVLLHRPVFPYLFWCVTAIFVGVTITRRASRRLEPLLVLGVFTVLTAISYAERHHLYFGMIAAVLVIALILQLLRRRRMAWAALAIFAAIVLAGPTTHLGVLGWMRRGRGPMESGVVELTRPPRARGAYMTHHDAQVLTSVERYVARSLRPHETFFDFTNSGLLYFVFDRDCPVREYEVAFYQSEAQQREVIRRIAANPNVRTALVPVHPLGRFTVDGVSNAERAPLVWAYLQEHFTPDFAEGDVVFWRRK